jgi:hypothetical protein
MIYAIVEDSTQVLVPAASNRPNPFSGPQALVSFKKYMPPNVAVEKRNISEV